jgi:crotonobetainyl-CoA:carnitine CoA-transferase CaiB-like acyl-CoA transferase
VLVSTDFREFWRLLVREHGVSDPTRPDMDRDARIAARRAAVVAFMRVLGSWTQIEAVMAKMNLAWGRVRAADTIREQATVAARGAVVDVDDRAGGTRPVTQSPYRFSAARSGVRGPAPHRGEHNAEVLAEWLGKSGHEIDALAERGVLCRDSAAGTA